MLLTGPFGNVEPSRVSCHSSLVFSFILIEKNMFLFNLRKEQYTNKKNIIKKNIEIIMPKIK